MKGIIERFPIIWVNPKSRPATHIFDIPRLPSSVYNPINIVNNAAPYKDTAISLYR